jgi:phage shock protein C
MQPRLNRSSSEVVVAGVCGGLAEYFHVDPVIVRLVFVLVTITSGFGLIVYPILWAVMPQAPRPDAAGLPVTPVLPPQEMPASPEPQAVRLREPAPHAAARVNSPPAYADQPPAPSEYRFDPQTGQRIQPGQAATGATTDLSRHAAAQPLPAELPADAATTPGPKGRNRVSWAGIVLVGLGVMLLAEQIGIDPDIMFPVLMVAVGALMLLRR